MTMDTPLLFDLYRQMLLIRRFEEEAARAYAQSHAGGFLHLYIGQEAIAVGASSAMRDDDYVFQTYRDHGIALARGMAPGAAMAELFGKDTGCSRGMGGSMHFFDAEHGFYGGWGIVGGHLALAAGTAFKSRYRGDDSVTVCFFGEGATNIGGFHEAFSLAGLWKLPIVFVCENNRYAMGTPLERTSPLTDLTLKAQGYGMASDRFEGSDVSVVREHLTPALARARSGEGPTFIEIDTYRFRGHSMSDPAKYRTREELEERKKADPLAVTREQLEAGGAEVSAFDELEEAVEREIAKAVEFAGDSPPAREQIMLDTVLVKGDA
ncbi:MAG: pyruvate dehydrogenase (acetyl-transferring) E1 component subunit alpha [Deltaproteobacteria bacterium]|nr:pyruvate dehydrogenase (acetyl-transferring) E1 component subunit alpha [Deltaproteobacteria bacterium]